MRSFPRFTAFLGCRSDLFLISSVMSLRPGLCEKRFADETELKQGVVCRSTQSVLARGSTQSVHTGQGVSKRAGFSSFTRVFNGKSTAQLWSKYKVNNIDLLTRKCRGSPCFFLI